MSNRSNTSPGHSPPASMTGASEPIHRAVPPKSSDGPASASPAVAIRLGRRADAATIAVFNIRMAHETEDLRLDPSLIERGVLGVFDDPTRGTYFIAEIESAVAGCLMVTHEWSDWRNGDMWWIQSVYVHPDHRRRGIFRRLYAHVRNAAMEAGAVTLRLYVEKHNEQAKQVYASLGMSRTEYDIMQETL